MSCNRCKGTTTNPHNFLLSCSECDKKWHHRCHIPPLGDTELTALIRATNDNDIDNGLSSWIGRCCKKKRAQVQAIPEKAVSRPPEVPKLKVHSASPAPAVPLNATSIPQVLQKPDLSSVSTQSTHRQDQTRQSTSHDGVAAPLKPDDEHATRDLSLPDPQTPTMTTFVRPAVQRSVTVSPNVAVSQPERSRTMPLPSTSYTASASGNVTSTSVADSHPVRLRENSLPLARTPPAQPTGSTYVQLHSQSSKCTSTSGSGSVDPALAASPEPMEIDSDLPTLDLRALTLNRASSSHHKTASRTHSPPPPSPTRPPAAEDDEIEDLYGPPLGLPSVYAPPPPEPPQPAPAPTEPRLLPALAAEDPRILAALERHEQREAARPRQGMRKAPAVRRAGKKRGGFVLVADIDRTRTDQCREPRGVFASYFA